MIPLFSENIFHVLGIRASTDLRSLRRLLEERTVQVQLGMRPQGLTEEMLRSFRQSIETPERRARAELFGLHAVDPGLPSEQLSLIRERAQGAGGLDRTLLYHDVAVTAHLVWALSHPDSTEGIESLQISLAAWRPVLREKDFWEYSAARSDGSMTADALRDACVRGLVGSAAGVAASFLDQGQLGPARALVRVIRDSALPGELIDEAMRDMTRDARAEVRSAVAQIAARSDDTVAGALVDEIALTNKVLGPYRRLGLLGVQAADADATAAAVRSVSVRIHNVAKDPFVAVALLDAGLEVVTAPRLVSGFASDRATVLRLHHQERAVTAWQAAQWAAAAAHATLAADVSDLAETERFRDVASRATASSSPSEVAEWLRRAQAPFTVERLAMDRRIDAAAHFQAWAGADRVYVDPSASDFGSSSTTTRSNLRAPTPVRGASTQRGMWIYLSVVAGAVLLVWAISSLTRSSNGLVGVPQTVPPGFPTTAAPVGPTATPFSPTQTPFVGPRGVVLQAQQMIMSLGDLPRAGYKVTTDATCGSGCWQRIFTATDANSTGNYFFSVVLDVWDANTMGASLVAQQVCTFVDSGGRPVNSKEIVAQVIGDGAKACRHDIGTAGDVVAYTYFTADRNVLIRVRSNPSLFSTTQAQATADLVAVARQQFAIIERVAPR